MILQYEIETRNGTIEYELEPTYEETKKAIIDIISKKKPQEIYDIMVDIADDTTDLEEYFYEDLKEYFEETAHTQYENSKQELKDYYYDYYHDKL